MKKMQLWMMTAILLCGTMGMLSGCKDLPEADLVVYGKIYTAEDNQMAEAFAVKDGKYVYVGDKKGAEDYIEEGKTEVVDYTDNGLVMPGCGNAHAHYCMGYGLSTAGTMIPSSATPGMFLKEILPEAVKNAKAAGATTIFGFGWNLPRWQGKLPTRQDLDKVCSDIPIYFSDDEGHKGLVNTLCLVKAGIMKEDGTVLKKEIRGGEIVMGADGTPTGFLKEQAGTFVRSFLDNDNLYTVEMAKETLPKIEKHLLSEGYTMYLDGWSNYFYNTNFYQAAHEMDQAGDLHFVLGTAYEIESWMDIDNSLQKASDCKKFASSRMRPNWIKLFLDGTVESGTGFVGTPYPDGSLGIANWEEQELTDITRKANEKGVTMHIHVMGDEGVNRVVNALTNGGKKELRNTLVHVRNVYDTDYKRMADNDICVTSGVIWHHMAKGLMKIAKENAPVGMEDKAYPMKSYFDNGVNVSIHSDYPALSGSPDDPFGIMEIAVTGVMSGENGDPMWTEELITREQALTAMTINCARQMLLENERGSIREGKYADFLLLTKDVLTCPVTEIHDAKPVATYFEGKKVYARE